MEPKDLVKTKHYMGVTHRQCEFFPCHTLSEFRSPAEFNCLFCTCPLYWLECPGSYEVITDADGTLRKDCSQCNLPHDGYERSWKLMNLSRFQKHPVIWKAPKEK